MSSERWKDHVVGAGPMNKPKSTRRSTALNSPVREVTIKEIIPGIYGSILISDATNDGVHIRMHMDDNGRRYSANDLLRASNTLMQLHIALMSKTKAGDW